MKITMLVENTAGDGLEGVHGLSFYIETERHRILMDAGPKGETLLHNAKALGVDLSGVDIAILSHGHSDHADGLSAFLEVNDRAALYLHPLAAGQYYSADGEIYHYIGMDPQIAEKHAGRFRFTGDSFRIDDTLFLFSDVRTAEFLSGANRTLFEVQGPEYTPDRFLHEQSLLLRKNGKTVLIAGCAHRGIINILNRAAALEGRAPDHVLAGFHLSNPGKKIDEPEALVRAVGEALKAYPSRYYTGHCTGAGPYAILKEILGDRIEYMRCGKTFAF